MSALPFRIITLFTGAVAAGEALALLVGMRILSGDDNPWISSKNDLFIVLDIMTGLGLVYVALAPPGAAWPYLFFLVAGLALLTHAYREWEYLAPAAHPFCANPPLFFVNNLKLAGLLAATVSGALLVMEA
jgi:hypothetical protein